MLGKVRRAANDYNMIEAGDKVAVGLSGGKDSIVLLSLLAKLRRFYPNKFELIAITLAMEEDHSMFSPADTLCRQLDVPYIIKDTDIARIIFEERNEKNPCSLCANMRRGALNSLAKELGCNKVALGHHRDDVLETYFMSTLYEGRIHTFSPVTYLDRKDITIIRPMIYIDEGEIRQAVKDHDLKPVPKTCKADGHTNRQYMKDLIAALEEHNPEIKNNLFGAIQRQEIDGWRNVKNEKRKGQSGC